MSNAVGYIIRYNELALKGNNRIIFEKKLISNIQKKLKNFNPKVRRLRGRILVDVQCCLDVQAQLSKVFGLSSFSPMLQIKTDLETIKKEGMALVMDALETHASKQASFRVFTKRVEKTLPMTSPEVSRDVAFYILNELKTLSVDLKNPQVELGIELREDFTLLYAKKLQGLGGLPVSSSSKVLTLLSGGIDSPVAAWLMLKRGCMSDFIHFHSYPFTSEQSKEKVIELAKKITGFQNHATLFVVPFGKIQEEIQKHCQERYRTLLYRRLMQRIATKVAERNKAVALVTGESLGQVASQTLENLSAVEQVTPISIIRPLITYDKHEVIAVAKKIGSFNISIQPFDDCCTLFQPKKPATKSRDLDLKIEEEKLSINPLVEEALSAIETVTL